MKHLLPKIAATLIAATVLIPTTVIAIDALPINIDFIATVGQDIVQACDTDGSTVSFTYGNSRPAGIKVTAVTVSGISSNCANAAIEFLDDSTTIASYTGTATSGSATLNTNIFTDQFTNIRITLLP